jgi:exosortase/archaeosortase family protein
MSDFINNLKQKYLKYLNHENKIIAGSFRILIFLTLFLFLFLILYFPLSQINFSPFFVNIISSSYSDIQVIDSESFLIDGVQINIIDVCTGWYELVVFIALLLATFEILFLKRIIGSLILIPVFLIFNLLRMYLMIYLILNVNLEFVDFMHTILFKVGLLVFFGIYYYIWFRVSKK